MSKKRKHGGVKQGFDLFERAQRELAKGNVKDALRDAKVCYREVPNAERHKFLERAYSARIEQLQQAGLHDQAGHLLAELTELGITADDVQAKLPRLRILLGLNEPAAGGTATSLWEENPELWIELADRAVLHPQQVPAKYEDIRRDGQRVRAALEAVERGEDAAATEQINDIPRRSPHADWKLFIRGLSAFYAGDAERTRANWDRLEAKRPALRIAQTLLVQAGWLREDQAALKVASGLRRLEYAMENDPVREQLKSMSEHFRNGQWASVFHTLRSFCQRFSQTHAPLIERITDLLWKQVIRHDRATQLKRLADIAPAPPLDPRWNRAYALWAEQSDEATYEAQEKYWRAYLEDLLQGGFLPPDERSLAAGLISRRLARMATAAAHEEETQSPFQHFFLDTNRFAERFRAEAVGYYQQSIRHAPRLRSAYDELAKLHLETDEDSWAVKVYQSLLKQFPDDYDTHVWLANYYLEKDQPDKAERHAQQAQRLKPRDPATLTLVWSQRVAMVRACAKQRKFTLARQEWETLQQCRTPGTEAYWLDLLRAAIEYKANNVDEARKYVAAAEAKLKEPTPIWMIMHTHAARFGLKREVKNDFGNRFKAAMDGPGCSETAGQLAKVLLPFVTKQIKYTGLATHQRLTLAYLQRCPEIDWNSEDLRNVVLFLMATGNWRHHALRDQLLAVGCDQFPQEPMFAFLAGQVAMEHGPFFTDLGHARKLFEQALKANETATHPLEPQQLKNAKTALSLIAEAAERRNASSFGPSLDDDEDDEDYDEDEFDEDEDYEDEDEFEGEEEYFRGQGGVPTGATFNETELATIVPPFMIGMFKQAAASMGISLPELVNRLLSGDLGPQDLVDVLDPPLPPEPSKRGRSKKKKASRR